MSESDHDAPAAKKRPTINDVARMAGVSKKTVSRVINRSPLVNTATREAVDAVIARTGFTPDPGARRLGRRRGGDNGARAQCSDQADAIMALSPVIPVVTIDDAAHAPALARALLAGGMKTIEITLRTRAALDAIRAIVAEAPEMAVGAGTILNESDLEDAVSVGARYALSPGATPRLMKAAREAGISFIPGVATSSEIMRGLDLGYTHFKFFPAEQMGGVSTLKALAGPLAAARFCPTGSITPEKAPAYLALPNVLCVGGSWVASAEAIKTQNWAAIEAAARQAVALR